MLRRDEAQRVAHERVKELVRVAQQISGDLNPDPVPEGGECTPDPTTQAKIEALVRAHEQAQDGLGMLRESEEAGEAPVSTVY